MAVQIPLVQFLEIPSACEPLIDQFESSDSIDNSVFDENESRGVRHCEKLHRVHLGISAGLETLPPSKKGKFPSHDDLNLDLHSLLHLSSALKQYFGLYY